MSSPPLFSICFADLILESTVWREFFGSVVSLLKNVRSIHVEISKHKRPDSVAVSGHSNVFTSLRQISAALVSHGKSAESDALETAIAKCVERTAFGGLELGSREDLSEKDRENILFLVDAWLEQLNSQERSRTNATIWLKAEQTRPMTLAEKIFTYHGLGNIPIEGLQVGNLARVAVDWVICSEATWGTMEPTMREIGATKIWRNDRFWLAGDHVVEPRIADRPTVRSLVAIADKARKDYKMTEYQGMNYTIMHTEFVRERAQPGMLVVGSDSHTCSAGAVGCLAIGLGSADVVMPLVTGETWFKVPESILINFIGEPVFGMMGKDVILYILQQLKRNTVAADRIVEFDGPGKKWLSIDARFAICNMCTEFGAITGAFVPDEITRDYVDSRKLKSGRSSSLYFRPDEGARYAHTFTIDLSKVESTIAVYPSPDNVVPVSEKSELQLDGVFIGACTTTEEELILGALVLEVGLREGLPLVKGQRRVVAGSLPIVDKLEKLGLLQIYEAAGFTRGVPGCSYCLAMAADQAGEGEVWLSSQNRNFKNRMGPGSFGSITSAATVAASSFSMQVTDPTPFLKKIDVKFFKKHTRYMESYGTTPVTYVEPRVGVENKGSETSEMPPAWEAPPTEPAEDNASDLAVIKSKIINLPDFLDTDALAPAQFLKSPVTEAEIGLHCLEYTHPEFRDHVKSGQQVVVGGKAFGCGSSREQAVMALKGCGVKAVIARSFGFIYSRNQPSLGLLGITMDDEEFYAAAIDGASIEIVVQERKIKIDGVKSFTFTMADMEWRLTVNHGLTAAYKKFGNAIWQRMTAPDRSPPSVVKQFNSVDHVDKNLQW